MPHSQTDFAKQASYGSKQFNMDQISHIIEPTVHSVNQSSSSSNSSMEETDLSFRVTLEFGENYKPPPTSQIASNIQKEYLKNPQGQAQIENSNNYLIEQSQQFMTENRLLTQQFQLNEEENQSEDDIEEASKQVKTLLFQEHSFNSLSQMSNGIKKTQNKKKPLIHANSSESDKKFDDRASLLSVNSRGTEKVLKLTIPQIIKKSRFKQFREAYIPCAFLITFLIIFLASIIVIYSNATSSIKTLDRRIQTVKTVGNRFSRLGITSSRILNILQIELLGWRSTSLSREYVTRLSNDSIKLIEESNNLENAVQQLNTEEKNYFYSEDIRLYESSYNFIPNAPYVKVDQFSAARRLFSTLQLYSAIYYPDSQDVQKAEDFLFGNLYNDFWSKHIDQDRYIQNIIKDQVKSIFSRQNLFQLIIMFSLTIAYLAIIIISLKSLLDTTQFLRLIINHNLNLEIEVFITDLSFYSGFISKKFCRPKLMNQAAQVTSLTTDKKLNKKQSQITHHWKTGNDTALKVQAFFRLILIIFLLSIPTILFTVSKARFLNSAKNINPYLQDINNFQLVYSKATEILNKMAVIVLRPQTKMLNEPIDPKLTKPLQELLDSVSTTSGYSFRSQELLSWNICNHTKVFVEPGNWLKPCETMFKGVNTRGLKHSIVALHTYTQGFLVEFQNYSSANISLAYSALLSSTQHLEAIFLVNEHIRRAVDKIHDDLTKELLDILQSGADKTINLFYYSLGSGIIIVGFCSYLLHKSLWKSRNEVTSMIEILPKHFVFANKQLRGFLIKQSRNFIGLLKKYEKQQHIDHKLKLKDFA